MKKYEVICQWIQALIEEGKVLPSQKLPSLRTVQNRFGVSLSVVIQAYQQLEIQGLVQSIPRSGYLVTAQDAPIPSLPPLNASLQVTEPKPSSLLGRVIELGLDPSLPPFACGMPSPRILPTQKISQSVQYIAKSFPARLTEYTPARGSVNLRKHLAKRFLKKGVNVHHSEVLITNGAIEGLSLAIKACTKPGDLIALESPVFFGILPILKELQRQVIEIPVNPEKGICIDRLLSALEKHTIAACIISGTVQNPLGCILENRRKKELVELANQYDFTLIEDNVYGECGFTEEMLWPLKSFDNNNRVIYVSSLSKCTAAGLRVGWMLPGNWMNQVEHIKYSQTLGTSALLQEATAHFMETGGYKYHLRKFRKHIHMQTMAMRASVLKHFPEGTKVSKPEGGFFLWVELPPSFKTRSLLEKALDEKLCYVPGSVFTQGSHFDSSLRISCGNPFEKPEQIQLQKLGAFFQKHKKNV